MRISTKLREIFNAIRQDPSIDRNILYNICASNEIDNEDFLYVDINDKVDSVSFIPNKSKYIDMVNNDETSFTLFNPTTVTRNHDIYSDYLNTLSNEEVQKIDEVGTYDLSHDYKIIKRANASKSSMWRDRYQLAHLESLNDGKQIICLVDLKIKSNISLVPSFVNERKSDLKVGRFLRKILPEDKASNKDIECIVNAFKSHNEYLKNIDKHFKVVEGEDIKYWYYEDKYVPNQSILNNSCMRFEKCQEYFDLYTEPENGVKMLILTDVHDRLLCRALLWTLDNGTKYMDRIYGREHTIKTFIQWGKDNGYTLFYDEGWDDYTEMKVTLKADYGKYFPYLDTFRYMINREPVDSNNEDVVYGEFINILTSKRKGTIPNLYCLEYTNGTYAKTRY